MQYCPECGNEVNEDARYCSECGTNLTGTVAGDSSDSADDTGSSESGSTDGESGSPKHPIYLPARLIQFIIVACGIFLIAGALDTNSITFIVVGVLVLILFGLIGAIELFVVRPPIETQNGESMKSVYRGTLAAIGIVVGFLTLVFLSQTGRYFQRALYGSGMALGMFGVYLIFSYVGTTVTLVSFRPRFTTAKFLSGVGFGLGGLILVSSFLLYMDDISLGVMLLLFAVTQLVISVIVYLLARVLGNDGDGTESNGAWVFS